MTLQETEQALGAWMPVVSHLFKESFMANIGQVLGRDMAKLQPALTNIFRAFTLCQPDNLKVVILGQDPYPGGEADGLAFSSGTGTLPYSLNIIFKELEMSGFGRRKSTSLEDWAEQGVLLLNTHLTTLKGYVNMHDHIGWEKFTGYVLWYIITHAPNVVFMLWGNPAQKTFKATGVASVGKHLVLEAYHPAASRYGYDFVGCKHFAKANEYLIANGKSPIKWV